MGRIYSFELQSIGSSGELSTLTTCKDTAYRRRMDEGDINEINGRNNLTGKRKFNINLILSIKREFIKKKF